jgi:hypothetical protein
MGATLVAPAVAISLAVSGGSVRAADPATGLSEAESRAAVAEADIASAQERVDDARAVHAAASRRADPAAEAARSAQAEARDLRSGLVDRQRRARARIAEFEATHRQELDDRDREIRNGVGLGLAALVGAGIGLGWGWFRASAAVAALGRIDLGQALGLCLGGGFLLIAAGAGLSEAGSLAGAIGAFLLGLGFVLPTAMLLGRHSAEVQRSRSKPLLGRERLPSWVPGGAGGLLLVLSIGALGSALLADEPSPGSVPTELREDAVALTSGPGARRLAEAKDEAGAARRQAAGPLAQQRAARVALRKAVRDLRGARARLADIEADERRFARRLAAQSRREKREAEEEAEEEERVEEEEEAEPVSECDPSYSPCVPPYPPDVDCSEIVGPVSVHGSDPHGLDADNDGVGCES